MAAAFGKAFTGEKVRQTIPLSGPPSNAWISGGPGSAPFILKLLLDARSVNKQSCLFWNLILDEGEIYHGDFNRFFSREKNSLVHQVNKC